MWWSYTDGGQHLGSQSRTSMTATKSAYLCLSKSSKCHRMSLLSLESRPPPLRVIPSREDRGCWKQHKGDTTLAWYILHISTQGTTAVGNKPERTSSIFFLREAGQPATIPWVYLQSGTKHCRDCFLSTLCMSHTQIMGWNSDVVNIYHIINIMKILPILNGSTSTTVTLTDCHKAFSPSLFLGHCNQDVQVFHLMHRWFLGN